MTLRTAIAGLALSALTSPAFSADFKGLETRSLYGLEGPSQARDISNEVLGNTALASEGIGSLAGRNLRTRFWTIRDKGIVPIHDHANRPAVFTILTGEIYEYTSTAEERILHTAGGLALEEGELAHWWLNEGDEIVHLIAFDVFEPRNGETEVAVVKASARELPEAEGSQHDLLGTVDLGRHFGSATGDGWVLSTYRTTIEPGGVFPSFVAPGEPLQGFVWEGTLREHRDGEALDLETHAGTTVAAGEAVWWENITDAPVVVFFGAVEPVSEVEGVPRVGPLAHGSHGD